MSFYAQSAGEEGVQMAGAAALELEDIAFTQYREPGILMWRGFSVQVPTRRQLMLMSEHRFGMTFARSEFIHRQYVSKRPTDMTWYRCSAT